jgi:hypothetical protein
MNPKNSSSQEPDDPLLHRMHREAMAERPAFSSELHHRILKGVRDEHLGIKSYPGFRPGYWPKIATAAAILITFGLTALWISRSYRSLVPNPSVRVAKSILPSLPQAQQLQTPSGVASFAASVNFGGILSASLWPLEIRITLPIPDVSPPSESVETQVAPSTVFPGSPERLLDGLQETTDSAQMALTDMVPPSMRAMAGLFMSEH